MSYPVKTNVLNTGETNVGESSIASENECHDFNFDIPEYILNETTIPEQTLSDKTHLGLLLKEISSAIAFLMNEVEKLKNESIAHRRLPNENEKLFTRFTFMDVDYSRLGFEDKQVTVTMGSDGCDLYRNIETIGICLKYLMEKEGFTVNTNCQHEDELPN